MISYFLSKSGQDKKKIKRFPQVAAVFIPRAVREWVAYSDRQF